MVIWPSICLQTQLAVFAELWQLCWRLLKIPEYDSDDKLYSVENLVGFSEWSFPAQNDKILHNISQPLSVFNMYKLTTLLKDRLCVRKGDELEFSLKFQI